MTRRDARIMARRLRRHPLVLFAEAEYWGPEYGWLVHLRTAHPPPHFPRPAHYCHIGAGVLYRPPRGNAAVLARLRLDASRKPD